MCGFVSSAQSTTEALLVPIEGILRPGWMVLASLQTPPPDLSDAFKVAISVGQDSLTREDRISPGRYDRCRTSLSSRFVDLTPVVSTIRREALYRVRHLCEKPSKRSGIGDRSVSELNGQNVPTLVCDCARAARTAVSASKRAPHMDRSTSVVRLGDPLATVSKCGVQPV